MPIGVAEGIEEHAAGLVRVLPVLLVAYFVDREQNIHQVHGRAQLLVACVRVGMCAQELAAALLEKSAFAVGNDLVAVDPGGGCFRGAFEVGVEGALEGQEGDEVREDK